MTTNTAACAMGCHQRGQHLTDCEDRETCRGCLPRQARHGRLCWPCHRRLDLLLTDAETVDRWLTANMASGQGAASEGAKITGSKEQPLPIKAALYDVRQELRDHWSTWVDWLIERHGLSSVRSSVGEDTRRLLSWLDRIEEWEQIDDLFEYTLDLFSRAHALAPWRPAMRRVGTIPCPECGEVNLAIYGGEEDITCLSCRHMIRAEHFPLWERIVREANGIGVAS